MRQPIAIRMIAVLCLACAGPALADNINPPPYVGLPLSYHAEWDQFTNGDFSFLAPDVESSVDDSDPQTFLYNAFSTHLDFEAIPGWALTPVTGGGFHNPTANATFAANTVNWVDFVPLKELRVQVTYTDVLGNGSPSIQAVTGLEVAAPNGSLPPGSITVPTPGGFVGRIDPNPNYFYEDWIIVPNPDWEQIDFFLPQGTIVEQIVIDSISTVPIPGAVWLFGSGLIGLIGVARRKQTVK